MTAPLFAALPGPRGPLRVTLDERLDRLTAAGHVFDADLVLVVQSLADRIDDANGGRVFRGFVMLTAEYRAARGDLFADIAASTGPDPLDAALAAFRASTSGDSPGSIPQH